MRNEDERFTQLFAVLQADLETVLKRGGNEPSLTFAVERQIQRMKKRAQVSRPNLASEAVTRFKALNDDVARREVTLDDELVEDSKELIRAALENFTSFYHPWNIQESLDFLILFDTWKFGPGASFGTRAGHPAEKMDEEWTCTTRSVDHVVRTRRNHPYLGLHDLEMGKSGFRVVSGSKLATVPKNEERERTIAIEPLGNMVLQLAAGRYFQSALKGIGLDITRQQPINKELARIGSIDGSLATLDLSDASDRIKPELVRLLLPDVWYRLLMDLRSPESTMPDGEVVALNMISTMGNGFTFPLMTMLITSLLYAHFRQTHTTKRLFLNWKRCAVFGDDIILESKLADGFIEVLEKAGLVVNRDKSFTSGPFRESCGGDYWNGYDVTPFYVKRLSNDPEVNVAINQVLDWSARHDVVLNGTLEYLFSLLETRLFVPEWCDPAAGVRTTTVARKYNYLSPRPRWARYNGPFQMSLAVGGYLTPRGSSLVYTPRQYKTRWMEKNGRLPKGFLTGRDPIGYPDVVSHRRDLLLHVGGFRKLAE